MKFYNFISAQYFIISYSNRKKYKMLMYFVTIVIITII